MSVQMRRWARGALVYLTVSFLAVGLWATVNPRGFYDGFPGGGRQWVAGDGPYNAHLVGDAGVGFLAVGVVLLLAAVWMDVRVIQAASAAAMVHDAPHLLYHLRHPNAALGSVDTALSNGALFLGALVALVLLVATARSQSPSPRQGADGIGREPTLLVGSPSTENVKRKEAARDETS